MMQVMTTIFLEDVDRSTLNVRVQCRMVIILSEVCLRVICICYRVWHLLSCNCLSFSSLFSFRSVVVDLAFQVFHYKSLFSKPPGLHFQEGNISKWEEICSYALTLLYSVSVGQRGRENSWAHRLILKLLCSLHAFLKKSSWTSAGFLSTHARWSPPKSHP